MKLIFLLFLSLSANANTLNTVLSNINAKHTIYGNIPVIDLKNISTSAHKHTMFKFEDESKELFSIDITHNISKADSVKIENNNVFLVNQAYLQKPTPYSGMISNKLECDRRFIPSESELKISGNAYKVLIAPVGKSFQHGTCQNELVSFWYCNVFFKTRDHLINIKTYLPKNSKNKCTEKISKFIGGYIEL